MSCQSSGGDRQAAETGTCGGVECRDSTGHVARRGGTWVLPWLLDNCHQRNTLQSDPVSTLGGTQEAVGCRHWTSTETMVSKTLLSTFLNQNKYIALHSYITIHFSSLLFIKQCVTLLYLFYLSARHICSVLDLCNFISRLYLLTGLTVAKSCDCINITKLYQYIKIIQHMTNIYKGKPHCVAQ